MCAGQLLGGIDVADRYCSNCGQELGEDARFCPSCGRPVHEVAHVPTPEADVAVPPLPNQQGAGSDVGSGGQGGRVSSSNSTRNALIALGVVGGLMLGVVGGLMLGLGAIGQIPSPVSGQKAVSLSEDFQDYPVGRWQEGSIHGPWRVAYDSNPCGRVGIVQTASGSKVYRSDLSGCSRLRATKTATRESYPTNIDVEWEFRVLKKPLAVKKGWHTAWMGWAHTGDNAWNNAILKQGVEGWEIGKFSPWCPDGGSNRNQCYFAAAVRPHFADGQWHTARVEQRAIAGGVEITVHGDGQKLRTVRDTTRRPNTVGNVLLYNEGSVVDFRDVTVKPYRHGGAGGRHPAPQSARGPDGGVGQ